MYAIALMPGPGQLVDVELNLGSILVLLEISLFVWLVWYGNRPVVLARFQGREPDQPEDAPPLRGPWERAVRDAKPRLRAR